MAPDTLESFAELNEPPCLLNPQMEMQTQALRTLQPSRGWGPRLPWKGGCACPMRRLDTNLRV